MPGACPVPGRAATRRPAAASRGPALDRLGQVGRRLQRLDLLEQVVGVLEVVGIEVAVQQRQRFAQALRIEPHQLREEPIAVAKPATGVDGLARRR
jgi:hypothetical protein